MQLIDPFPGKYDAADPFGSLGHGRSTPHTGSDWMVAGNTPIPAIGAGVVAAKGWHNGNGNYVAVRLDDGLYYAYLHLSEPANVNVGDRVALGQHIAKVGNTGTNSQGNHLHVTISDSVQAYVGLGSKVDPYAYIHQRLNAPPSGAARQLKRGMVGDDVRRLQERLNRDYPLYSNLVVDGDFGPATDAVVREFQRRAGLVEDGIAGPNTLGALGL